MANFPFSLEGTTLNYVLPDFKIAIDPPENRIYPLEGTDCTLAFSTPEELTLRQATHHAGLRTPDQLIQGRFFEYVQQYTTICRAGDHGFLSGPFSGCWFVRFFMSGAYYAAHIGTNFNLEQSAEVKRKFSKYTERTIMHTFSCFNPNRVWTDVEKLEMIGNKKFYNLAYINPEGKCYSIFLVRNDIGKVELQTKSSSRLPQQVVPDGKPGWKPPDPNAKKQMFVSHSFIVKGVREVVSRKWEDVKESETGFL